MPNTNVIDGIVLRTVDLLGIEAFDDFIEIARCVDELGVDGLGHFVPCEQEHDQSSIWFQQKGK